LQQYRHLADERVLSGELLRFSSDEVLDQARRVMQAFAWCAAIDSKKRDT
jgi:hypothetical protein